MRTQGGFRFDTRICGIPCEIEVHSVSSGEAPYLSGHPDSAEPGWDPEIDFTVRDRKGYVANWLAEKLTDEDEARIIEAALEIANDDAVFNRWAA